MSKLKRILLFNFCLLQLYTLVQLEETRVPQVNVTSRSSPTSLKCPKCSGQISTIRISKNGTDTRKIKRQIYVVNPLPTNQPLYPVQWIPPVQNQQQQQYQLTPQITRRLDYNPPPIQNSFPSNQNQQTVSTHAVLWSSPQNPQINPNPVINWPNSIPPQQQQNQQQMITPHRIEHRSDNVQILPSQSNQGTGQSNQGSNVLWTGQQGNGQNTNNRVQLSWLETELPQGTSNQNILLLPSPQSPQYEFPQTQESFHQPQFNNHQNQQQQQQQQYYHSSSEAEESDEDDIYGGPVYYPPSTLLYNAGESDGDDDTSTEIWDSEETDVKPNGGSHFKFLSRWPGHVVRQRIVKPLLVGTVTGVSLFLSYKTAQKLQMARRREWLRNHQQHLTGHSLPQNIPDIPFMHPGFGDNWLEELMAASMATDIEEEGGGEKEESIQEYNNRVARNAVEFLRANPDIETYIRPSMTQVPADKNSKKKKKNEEEEEKEEEKEKMKVKPHQNSYVNLTLFKDEVPKWNKNDRAGSVTTSTTTSSTYRILCSDEEVKKQKKKKKRSKVKGKLCENVIGVGVAKDKGRNRGRNTGRTIYFDLKDGNDTAIGRPSYKNIFLVENGQKLYKGQEKSDTFILVKAGVTGLLDGGPDESNSLILRKSFDNPNKVIFVNLTEEGVGEVRQSRGSTVFTQNLQIIHGRANAPENFVIDSPRIRFIDGHGGKSMENPDIIEIHQKELPKVIKWWQKVKKSEPYKNLEVRMSSYTKLINHAREGDFTYIFEPTKSKHFEFQIDSLTKKPYDIRGKHRILFNWNLAQMSSLKLNKNILTIKSIDHDFTFPLPIAHSPERGDQEPKLYTMFDDGVTPEAELVVTPTGQVNVIHQLDSTHSSALSNTLPDNLANNPALENKKFGFPTTSNIFNIHEGHWNILGGHSPDIFILHEKFSGHLNGGSKWNNSIVLNDDFLATLKFVEVNLQRKIVAYEEPLRIGGQGQARVSTVSFENIQRVVGRRNASDLITIDCSTIEVDGRGGRDVLIGGTKRRRIPDIVIIPSNTEACPHYRTSIVIHQATIVRNYADNGEFNYFIRRLGVFNAVTKSFPSGSTHNYILPYNFDSIRGIVFDRPSRQLFFKYNLDPSQTQMKNGLKLNETTEQYHSSHWLKFSKAPGAIYHIAPNIVTKDGVRFKVRRSDGSLMAFVGIEENSNFLNRGFKGHNGFQHTIALNNALARKTVEIRGGDQDDIFILGASTPENRIGRVGLQNMATIDGAGGHNVLQIEENFLPNQDLRIDMHRGQIFSEKVGSSFRLKSINFGTIQGRRRANETIVVGCETHSVSGMGGHDLIIVPPDLRATCNGTRPDIVMEFSISSNPVMTRVINFAQAGTFIYNIQGVNSFDVEKGGHDNRHWATLTFIQHIYQLSFKTGAVDKAWYEPEGDGASKKGKLAVRVGKNVARFSVSLERGKDIQLYNTQPKVLTQDGMKFTVNVKTGAVAFIKNGKQY